MKIWIFLLALKSLAAPTPTTVYTICFNSGAKCHSVYDDHTQASLNGNVLGEGKLSPKFATELKQKLDSILLPAKNIGACSDLEYSKMVSGNKVVDQTYCYEELPMTTKKALAQWIKSLPKIKSPARKPQANSRLNLPF